MCARSEEAPMPWLSHSLGGRLTVQNAVPLSQPLTMLTSLCHLFRGCRGLQRNVTDGTFGLLFASKPKS